MGCICPVQGAGIRRPDAFTKLHLRFDNELNAFKDLTGKTVTAYNNATQTNTQRKFIGKAGYFPAYNDYIEVPTSSDLTFNNDTDFTVEWWMYGRTRTASQGMAIIGCTQNDTAIGGWAISEWGGSYFGWWDAGNTSWFMNSSASYVANAWAHYALVRRLESTNKVFRWFVNGALIKEANGNTTIPTNGNYNIRVGAEPNPRSAMYLGTSYLDEIRISSCARYTAAFTPPTRRK